MESADHAPETSARRDGSHILTLIVVAALAFAGWRLYLVERRLGRLEEHFLKNRAQSVRRTEQVRQLEDLISNLQAPKRRSNRESTPRPQ